MPESLAVSRSHATIPAAALCREVAPTEERGTIVPDDGGWDFAAMFASLWPRKTAAHLHHLIGAAERTCRAWASGARSVPGLAVVALLRSEQGGRVLAYIMDGSKARWWIERGRDRLITSIFDAQCAGLTEHQQHQLAFPFAGR